jgi:hypothetical protein
LQLRFPAQRGFGKFGGILDKLSKKLRKTQNGIGAVFAIVTA